MIRVSIPLCFGKKPYLIYVGRRYWKTHSAVPCLPWTPPILKGYMSVLHLNIPSNLILSICVLRKKTHIHPLPFLGKILDDHVLEKHLPKLWSSHLSSYIWFSPISRVLWYRSCSWPCCLSCCFWRSQSPFLSPSFLMTGLYIRPAFWVDSGTYTSSCRLQSPSITSRGR